MPGNETPRVGRGRTLAATLGVAGMASLAALVGQFEGKENVPYRDVVGIWTVCYGDTANVRPGQRASNAECEARLARQLEAHGQPVIACVPGLAEPEHRQQLIASVSLAYNIGVTGFCRSTAARRFNAGQWRGGCDAFMAWNRAGGRVINGLTRRRSAERAICLRGLPT